MQYSSDFQFPQGPDGDRPDAPQTSDDRPDAPQTPDDRPDVPPAGPGLPNIPWEPYYGVSTPPPQNASSADLRTARKHFSQVGLGVFVYLVATFGATFVLVFALEALRIPWQTHPWGIWLMNFLPQYAVALPLAYLTIRAVPAEAPQQRSFSAGDIFTMVAIGFAMMMAGNTIGNYVNRLVTFILRREVSNPVEELVAGSALLPRVLCVVILAPIFEELFFRKLLIDRLRLYGGKLAVIVSAVIFGLFHGNLSQLFYAAALGLVLGYVYQRTGRLRYSIGLHMLINFVGGVIAPLLSEHLPSEALMEELQRQLLLQGQLSDSVLTELTRQLGWIFGLLGLALVELGLSLVGMILLCVKAKKLVFSPAERALSSEARFQAACLNAGMLLLLLGCGAEILLSLFT